MSRHFRKHARSHFSRFPVLAAVWLVASPYGSCLLPSQKKRVFPADSMPSVQEGRHGLHKAKLTLGPVLKPGWSMAPAHPIWPELESCMPQSMSVLSCFAVSGCEAARGYCWQRNSRKHGREVSKWLRLQRGTAVSEQAGASASRINGQRYRALGEQTASGMQGRSFPCWALPLLRKTVFPAGPAGGGAGRNPSAFLPMLGWRCVSWLFCLLLEHQSWATAGGGMLGRGGAVRRGSTKDLLS